VFDPLPSATSNPPLWSPTGRIGLISAYFFVLALVGVIEIFTVWIVAPWPEVGLHAPHTSHPWVATADAVVWSWSALQTARMLERRRRLGLVAAGICFAAAFLPSGTVALTRISVGMAIVGLALVASLWSHLE